MSSKRATAKVMAALCLLLGSTAARAQDAPDAGAIDEELLEILSTSVEVWSATKTARRIEEAPAIVVVVTGAEIRDFGYQSVNEVLQHVLGFYVIDDHIIPNVAARGVSGGLFGESGILKVMINGHSVAFRTTSGNWLGPELVPLSVVERIEIVRGPASALYGADAFFGVVNIVTRNGEQLNNGELRLGAGLVAEHNPAFDVDGSLGSWDGPWDIVASARYSSEDRSGLRLPAFSPAPVIPDSHAGQTAATGLHLGSLSALVNVTRHFSGGGSLAFSPYFSSIERGGEFASWSQLSNGIDTQGRTIGTQVSLAQGSASLTFRWPLSESLKLSFDSTFFAGGPTARDRIDVASELYYVKRRFSFIGVDSTAEATWSGKSLSFVGGLSFLYDLELLPTNSRVLLGPVEGFAAGQTLDVTQSRLQPFVNPGVYLQGSWNPEIRSLSFTGGVRYDYHNLYGSQFSGRIAAVWSPTSALNLKALYGNAFKAPSAFLLFAVPAVRSDVLGNAGLKAQHVNTVELEAQYRFNRHFSIRTDVAANFLLNAADFTQAGLNKVARNVANINTLSWETRLDWKAEPIMHAYLQGALTTGERDNGEGYAAALVGRSLSIYPGVIIQVGASRELPILPFRLSVEAAYIGPRQASDSNALEAGLVYTLKGYARLEASLSTVGLTWLGKRLELKLIGKNLLGTTGPDPGFSGVDYPLPARLLMLQMIQEL